MCLRQGKGTGIGLPGDLVSLFSFLPPQCGGPWGRVLPLRAVTAANFQEQCGHSRAGPRTRRDMPVICPVCGAPGGVRRAQLALRLSPAPGSGHGLSLRNRIRPSAWQGLRGWLGAQQVPPPWSSDSSGNSPSADKEVGPSCSYLGRERLQRQVGRCQVLRMGCVLCF